MNRHLSFGIGVHRCIGSNVARLNFRVALPGLLLRLGPFQLAAGEEVVRTWKGISYLPVTLSGTSPAPRSGHDTFGTP
jgi:cytochrome P450